MKNMNTWAKLALGFSMTLVLTVVLGASSWMAMHNVDEETTLVETVYMPMLQISGAVEARVTLAVANLKDYFAYGDEQLYEAAMRRIQEAGEQVNGLEQMLGRYPSMGEFLVLVRELRSARENVTAVSTRTAEIRRRMTSRMEGQFAAAVKAYAASRKCMNREQELLTGGDPDRRQRIVNLMAGVNDEITEVRLALLRALSRNSLREGEAIPARVRNILDRMEEALPLVEDPDMRIAVEQLRTDVRAYGTAVDAYLESWRNFDEMTPVRQAAGAGYLAAVQKLSGNAIERTARVAGNVSAASASFANRVLVLALVIVGLGCAVAFLLTKVITTPMRRCLVFAEAVAGGDLDRQLDLEQKDEMGRLAAALRDMVTALKGKIHEADKQSEQARSKEEEAVRAMRAADASSKEAQAQRDAMLEAADRLQEVAGIVSSASTQLSAQITQSERGAAEQAARVTETATAMEEMTSTVLEVAHNAGSASEISTKTRAKAESGEKIVKQAVESIRQVQRDSLALKSDMEKLGGHAQSINQIMGVISDIADQTNLLALNAAIEAARAGEAGRGFAVVAEEVRKLAEESNQSSQKIGVLVKRNQTDMEKAVAASKSGTEGVAIGIEAVTAADDTFKGIVTSIENLSAEIHAISSAIRNMAEGSQTMLSSIHSIDEVGEANSIESESVSSATEEQSASMQDIALASKNLATLADELQSAIALFKV